MPAQNRTANASPGLFGSRASWRRRTAPVPNTHAATYAIAGGTFRLWLSVIAAQRSSAATAAQLNEPRIFARGFESELLIAKPLCSSASALSAAALVM
jgi:hypothetical protein